MFSVSGLERAYCWLVTEMISPQILPEKGAGGIPATKELRWRTGPTEDPSRPGRPGAFPSAGGPPPPSRSRPPSLHESSPPAWPPASDRWRTRPRFFPEGTFREDAARSERDGRLDGRGLSLENRHRLRKICVKGLLSRTVCASCPSRLRPISLLLPALTGFSGGISSALGWRSRIRHSLR